jgi:hypothetical protein
MAASGSVTSAKRPFLAEAGIHNWLKGLAWWEEDCDWCIPYLVFADEYKAWDERNGMGEYFATNMTNAIKPPASIILNSTNGTCSGPNSKASWL